MKNKLDLGSKLFLSTVHANVIDHIKVEKNNEKLELTIDKINKHDVYIFENNEEYKNYFLMYLDKIDEELIEKAIIRICKKGQIIAFKGICEYIIIKEKTREFYNLITQEKITNIHFHNKLTPLEQVQKWESQDLCVLGNQASGASYRCEFFNHDCHECLLECASHKLEYEKIDFKLIDYKTKKISLSKLSK